MKRMFLDIEEAQNSLNWQETGKFEEKRGFQSSPIGRVNRGVGNTASRRAACPLRKALATLLIELQYFYNYFILKYGKSVEVGMSVYIIVL